MTIKQINEHPNTALVRLRSEVPDVFATIERSLAGDPDGEACQGVSDETLNRTIQFLARLALALWDRSHLRIDAPLILFCRDASIDLWWNTMSYELLVNMPAEPNAYAEFYGERSEGRALKGTFDPTTLHAGIIAWFSGR